MRISNAEVSMASKSSYSAKEKVTHSTIYRPCINMGGFSLIQGDDNKIKAAGKGKESDFLSSFNYSMDSKGQLKEVETPQATSPTASVDNVRIRMATISYLLRLILFGDKSCNENETTNLWENAFNSTNNFLVTDEATYSYEESQSTSFSAQGSVFTEDGRELKFNYSFEMSASFKAEYKEVCQWQQQIFMDPLVINLDSNPREISDQKFYFDLDCDGENEEISTLGAGRGFLAYDQNEDGKINDGSELFGTKSGDGFSDLSKYDEDGNGWIDENDSIFEKLRIWTINENGEEELYTLKAADVGAICLNRASTEFISRDSNHEAVGVIRKTGFFLHESTGRAGAVQHVDLAT